MELDSYSSRQGQVMRACGHDNGSSCPIKLDNTRIFRAEELSIIQDIHYCIELVNHVDSIVMPSV